MLCCFMNHQLCYNLPVNMLNIKSTVFVVKSIINLCILSNFTRLPVCQNQMPKLHCTMNFRYAATTYGYKLWLKYQRCRYHFLLHMLLHCVMLDTLPYIECLPISNSISQYFQSCNQDRKICIWRGWYQAIASALYMDHHVIHRSTE